MQPGPGHGAGVDATQLLADGGEEGADTLQVVQEQDHTVVTHCGQVGWVSTGCGVGMGQGGSHGVGTGWSEGQCKDRYEVPQKIERESWGHRTPEVEVNVGVTRRSVWSGDRTLLGKVGGLG